MEDEAFDELETKVKRLAAAFKASERENAQLREHKAALLEEMTRLNDRVVLLDRDRREAFEKVCALSDRLEELERHVQL